MAGEEKGIDVRIALDVIRMAHRREYDGVGRRRSDKAKVKPEGTGCIEKWALS